MPCGNSILLQVNGFLGFKIFLMYKKKDRFKLPFNEDVRGNKKRWTIQFYLNNVKSRRCVFDFTKWDTIILSWRGKYFGVNWQNILLKFTKLELIFFLNHKRFEIFLDCCIFLIVTCYGNTMG